MDGYDDDDGTAREKTGDGRTEQADGKTKTLRTYVCTRTMAVTHEIEMTIDRPTDRIEAVVMVPT